MSLMDAGDISPARWVLDRVDDEAGRAWLMPDFAFSSWPEPYVGAWHDFRCRADAIERNLTWADKTPLLFWRGVTMTDGRRELVEMTDRYDWLDARSIDWSAWRRAARH